MGERCVDIHHAPITAHALAELPRVPLGMVKGGSLIQMMRKELGKELWHEKEKLALTWLEETLPTLKRLLTSDAWFGVK